MNNLPTELVHNIFILLPVIQKKECMLVCRRWANIIQKRSLLHTVYIDNTETFHKLLSLLKDRPELVLQVENLTLFSCMDEDSEKSILTMFPNVKVIRLSAHNSGILKPSTAYKSSDQEFHWKAGSFNRMYHIEDFYECGLTRLLLSHGLCSHLTTLDLKIRTTDKLPPNIFPLLKDMPVLKKLEIDHSPLTIDTMEMLHTNIPSLQVLRLFGVDLLEGTVPTNINPATALTTLYIWTYDHDIKGKAEWLQYICKKYTHLEHFDYEWDEMSQGRELRNVYGSEYLPLLQRIGPQLKSLTLSGFLDRNNTVLKSLDDFGCHLTELELNLADDETAFSALVKTKQFKLIEKLSLFNIDIDEDFSKLKKMEKLKSLTLYFVQHDSLLEFNYGEEEEIEDYIKEVTIDLNELFRSFPKHVKSVTIANLYVDFDDTKAEQQEQYPNIEELVFKNIKSNKKIYLFISGYFPNLHSLSLIDCFKKDEMLVLLNHHFSYLELLITMNCGSNVSLVTTDNHKPRFYYTSTPLKKGYSEFDDLLLPTSQDDLIGDNMITVVCGSVKRLVLDNKEVFLISDKYQFQSLIK